MSITVVGGQFGDEGKGKVIERLSRDADLVARYQGGVNASHTVDVDGTTHEFAHVPSGVLNDVRSVLGPGCLVDPPALCDAIDGLRDAGFDPSVAVSERAHVTLPFHRRVHEDLDRPVGDPDLDDGDVDVSGITPTYATKSMGRGLRVADLLDEATLESRLAALVPRLDALATGVGADGEPGLDVDSLFETCLAYAEQLRSRVDVVDGGALVRRHLDDGSSVLFESSQGSLLDLDHGTYPYVTASNPSAGYVPTGSGAGPAALGDNDVLGVVKAYVTTPGEVPLPTAMRDPGAVLEAPLADARETGGVGWFDLPLARHAAATNGFDALVVNHLDAFTADGIRVARAYDLDGETLTTPPATFEAWTRCEPEYETFDGWDASDVRPDRTGLRVLPPNAREFVEYLGSNLSADVYAVGYGPREEDFAVLDPTAVGY